MNPNNKVARYSVKSCMHSPGTLPRFDVAAGDEILISNGTDAYFATILSIGNDFLRVSKHDGEEEDIPKERVLALSLE